MLDPDFMRLKYPTLYEQWRDLTRGKRKDPTAIVRKFDSEWVFTDRKHKKFIRMVAKGPRFVEQYSDGWSKVYRLQTSTNT